VSEPFIATSLES